MKLIHFVFALIILISVLLIIVAVSPVPSNISSAHPTIVDMKVGGDGAKRLEHIGTTAYWLQNAVLLLSVLFISLGVKERNRTKSYWACLIAIALAMIGVWYNIYVGHQTFLITGETGYFLGFPTSTAWMIYGIWASAALLTLLYVIGFRRFIYTHEDERAFEELLSDIEDEKLKQGVPDLTQENSADASTNNISTNKAN